MSSVGAQPRSLILARSLVLFGLSLGCELTAELGAYPAHDTETSGGSGTDTDATSSGSGEESGTAGGETGTGDGDGDQQTGDGDGDGDGDTNGLCTIDGSEDPCRTCVKYVCCEHLLNCAAESGCNCMVECLLDSDPVTCAMTCTPGPAYFKLLQCQATNCAAVCE